MPVARTDKLSQEKFDSLAAIANAKPTLDGRPYSFSGHAWRTELERLRVNLIHALTYQWIDTAPIPGSDIQWSGGTVELHEDFQYPIQPQALCSGPWPIPPSSTVPNTLNPSVYLRGDRVSNQANGDILYESYFVCITTAKQVSYIFPALSEPPQTQLLYSLTIPILYVRPSQLLSNGYILRFTINSPVAGRLHGQFFLHNFGPFEYIGSGGSIRWNALGGANAGNFALTVSAGYPILTCDFQTSGDIELILTSPDLRYKAPGVGQGDGALFQIGPDRGANLTFDLSFASPYKVAGIHPTQNVYRIDTESDEFLNGISVTQGMDSEPVNSDGGGAEVFYVIGNLAGASIRVSDSTQGIFIGKTKPISRADFYQDTVKLEPTRKLNAPTGKITAKSGSIEKGRPAVFDTIPRFAVQRSTDPITDLSATSTYTDYGDYSYRGDWTPAQGAAGAYNVNDAVSYTLIPSKAGTYRSTSAHNTTTPGADPSWIKFNPVITYDARVYYGSIIRDVYVRRQPTKQGDFYLPDPDAAELQVELGCIRNNAFVAFETVTIPAGKHGVRIFPFWPVFDIINPLGLCAKKLIYRCAEPVDVQASLMMPQPEFGTACHPPKLADFYNDTESLLNLL